MLKQRDGWWHVHIPVRGKKPIRQATGFRVEGKTPPPEAKELHDKLASESWRESRLGERPRKRWEQAVSSYLTHARKRSLGLDKARLRWLDTYLAGEPLEIVAGVGDDGFSVKWDAVLKARRETYLEENGRPIADSTLNRYRALVVKILNDSGMRNHRLRKYEEPKPRKDFLTKELAMETLAKAPDWAKDPMLFDWAEGPRTENLLGLEWSWIDLQRKIWRPNPEDFKNGECPELPLSDFAIQIIRRQLGKHQRYVFVRDGDRIHYGEWRYMWDQIRPIVNGKRITFHAAGRKTWASWMRQAGVSCEDIQDAGGWKTLSIVKETYAHIQPSHLLQHVNKLGETLHEIDTQQRIQESTKAA
jgi:integrase